jgi:hypothetical protein
MNDLSNALHDWAGRTEAGQPPVADLIAAGTKRRARNRAASAGVATLALAAVVGVSITATGSTTPRGSAEALGTSGERTPAMELAAAAAFAEGTSYKFKINSTLNLAEWQIDNVTSTCTGAADPAKATAIVKGGVFEVRLIKGQRYASKGPGTWVDMGKSTVAGAMLCGDENVPSLAASDPASALKALRKVSTVKKVSGGYEFSDTGFTGTVKVSGGKISEFTYDVDQKKSSSYPAYTKHVVMKLSDYGTKVSVKKPL